MAPNWPTYAWYIAAAVFGIAGIYLLIKFLIGDRSKGRRRCPNCWYDMSATPGMTCPECGRTPRREHRFLHSRRQIAHLVFAALLLMLSWIAWRTPEAVRHGWRTLIPTTALLIIIDEADQTFIDDAVMPQTAKPGPATSLTSELAGRFVRDNMWTWQRKAITRRIDPYLPDLSHAVIIRSYPHLAKPFLVCTSPSLQLTSNNRLEAIWIHRNISLRPHDSTIEMSYFRSAFSSDPTGKGINVAAPRDGRLTIDISVQEFGHRNWKAITLSRDSFTFRVTPDDPRLQLVPTSDDAISHAVRDFTMIFVQEPNVADASSLELRLQAQTCADLARVAVEMNFELFLEGRILASGRAMRHRDPRCTLRAAEGVTLSSEFLADPKLRLRVTGRIDVSECACRFEQVWTGSFELDWGDVPIEANPSP